MKTKITEITGTFIIGDHELTFMQIREQTFVQFSNKSSEEFDDGMHRVSDMKNFINIASKILKNKTDDEIIEVVTKNNTQQPEIIIIKKQKRENNYKIEQKDKVIINEFMLN